MYHPIRQEHELLELADLADKKERLIANLSYGEKRILCILQTLLGKPEILILTSPISGVLPNDAQRIRELVKYFSDTYSIFLCTPMADDLGKMCDEILILQDGTLKTVLSANDESLAAELSATPCEPSPVLKAEVPQKRTRWKMLTEKSDDYELLNTNEKEGKD